MSFITNIGMDRKEGDRDRNQDRNGNPSDLDRSSGTDRELTHRDSRHRENDVWKNEKRGDRSRIRYDERRKESTEKHSPREGTKRGEMRVREERIDRKKMWNDNDNDIYIMQPDTRDGRPDGNIIGQNKSDSENVRPYGRQDANTQNTSNNRNDQYLSKIERRNDDIDRHRNRNRYDNCNNNNDLNRNDNNRSHHENVNRYSNNNNNNNSNNNNSNSSSNNNNNNNSSSNNNNNYNKNENENNNNNYNNDKYNNNFNRNNRNNDYRSSFLEIKERGEDKICNKSKISERSRDGNKNKDENSGKIQNNKHDNNNQDDYKFTGKKGNHEDVSKTNVLNQFNGNGDRRNKNDRTYGNRNSSANQKESHGNENNSGRQVRSNVDDWNSNSQMNRRLHGTL